MSELQTTPRLSLFQIEAELLQLIDQREDALERCLGASTPGKHEEAVQEIAVLDGLIRDYLKREVRKVDNIAYTVKEFEARAVAQAEEAKRMIAKAEKNYETVKRIKQMVLEVMQEFGEKKLPGRLFTITRQGNGGVQALTIAQPDLVPLGFKRVTVEIREPSFPSFAKMFDGEYRILEELHVDTRDIRHALEQGFGVMGCKLEERGEHIRIK